jgi:hypothetical protein
MGEVDEGMSSASPTANNRWLVSKTEYEELQKANRGIVKIGWKANKLNCCSPRKDLHVRALKSFS